eukprot:645012-Amphidinium_carterae.1
MVVYTVVPHIKWHVRNVFNIKWHVMDVVPVLCASSRSHQSDGRVTTHTMLPTMLMNILSNSIVVPLFEHMLS